ncbi:DUF397 domain-containing protein [Embleya sp. NPDC059237]|uniref:DUF397 domain-containing protein n=1 Tax=Embleya sp. NPDC059237 TaxID=3346784 RepID=UPI0036ACA945
MHVVDAGVVAAEWRKSTYSGGVENSCVEAAPIGRLTGVRDSKIPTGPAHLFTPTAWASLVDAIKK